MFFRSITSTCSTKPLSTALSVQQHMIQPTRQPISRRGAEASLLRARGIEELGGAPLRCDQGGPRTTRISPARAGAREGASSSTPRPPPRRSRGPQRPRPRPAARCGARARRERAAGGRRLARVSGEGGLRALEGALESGGAASTTCASPRAPPPRPRRTSSRARPSVGERDRRPGALDGHRSVDGEIGLSYDEATEAVREAAPSAVTRPPDATGTDIVRRRSSPAPPSSRSAGRPRPTLAKRDEVPGVDAAQPDRVAGRRPQHPAQVVELVLAQRARGAPPECSRARHSVSSARRLPTPAMELWSSSRAFSAIEPRPIRFRNTSRETSNASGRCATSPVRSRPAPAAACRAARAGRRPRTRATKRSQLLRPGGSSTTIRPAIPRCRPRSGPPSVSARGTCRAGGRRSAGDRSAPWRSRPARAAGLT